ncbi:hypothetical protein HHI36_020250 [Cryptolaemus montrouzieri]|uniref:Chemosensory protein n=1 Tax=Cryptolaemus montrouzieri TaxID=559131 RepID=A0ABD2N9P4_9CUCU
MNYFAVCSVFVLVLSSCRGDLNKYENLEIDDMLKNERIVQNFYQCLMTGEKCIPEAAELRENLPEIVQTGCPTCSEKLVSKAKKVIDHFITNKPEWWAEIEAKYDPDGTYRKKHAALNEKRGLKL